MKPLSLIIAFTLFAFNSYANRIDQLKTDKEVTDFIVSLDSAGFHAKYSPKFYVLSTDSLWANNHQAAEIHLKNWEKVDLNGDGLNDIVVLANWYNIMPFVVIDLGNDKFKLIRLQYGHGGDELAKIIHLKNQPLLLFYASKQYINTKGKTMADYYRDTIVVDTLIYRINSFAEYNSQPKSKKISSITFTTNTCLGSCPKFKLSINSLGIATYDGDFYAEPKGKHSLKISAGDLQPLCDALNYIDFKKIQEHYSVSWTDSPTATLSIKFADGSIKNISDYGERGTWSLRKIYSLFFGFYKSQPWAKN